jgi:hypothetical protein
MKLGEPMGDASFQNHINIREPHPHNWFTEHTILTTRKTSVEEINECLLDILPGQMRTYLSADKVLEDQPDGHAHDLPGSPYLQSLIPNGFPLAKLG